MDKEKFRELWQRTIDAVSVEIRRRVISKDRHLINNINSYYRVRLLNGLWYSTTLVNDNNEFLTAVYDESPEKYVKIKRYLYANTTLISEDEESKLVSKIMLISGGLGSIMSAMKKNHKLLIVTLGFSALGYFYAKHNQDKIISQAKEIVTQKLVSIGKEVERILDE